MKKILNLITISTLTTVIPTPLISNISLIEKVKQEVGITNSNNEYVPLRAINRLKKTIFSLSIDGDGIIWAIIDSEVNKSIDNGKTFNKVINGFPSGTYTSSVNSLTIDKNGIIWVATTNYEGLYKSTDNGKTFQQIKIKGFPNSQIDKIAVSQNGDIYASKQDYIYKSIDDGKKFEKFYSFNVSNQIKTMNIQNNGTIWVGTNKGLYKFSADSDTPTKLNDWNILAIDIDKATNIYCGTDDSLYKFSADSNTLTKIDGINDAVSSIAFDKIDNVYFGTYSNILNILQTALSWTKEQSQFNLIDSTKNKNWTRNDLLTVDGELNIEINNNNIDKVLFDNVQQTTTNKKWSINVKPETSEKDHNLQVIFTLYGKQYTSEIIVSMQAKIDPPTPPIQENLSDVIKFGSDNNLGNILDNNDETIISAINQKNSRIIDFSQIEIEKKDMHSATLTAKKDSKSYQGSVLVKYNVVLATVVDLKIDLQPTSPSTQVDIDYVGQIDKTIITNPVNSFYYANSESKITMINPTASSVITGKVYGCDEQWTKSSTSPKVIDPTNGIVLDGSQLSTNNGKYVIELQDNLGNHNNIYLQIAPKQEIAHYFDTDNGKQFEKWAKANGQDNIHGYSVRQLNKLFEESKSWIKQANDNQLANAVADWFKTKGNVSSKQTISKEQIVEQLKQQIPKIITIDKFDTSNYDLNKVSFEIKGIQFQPNEKVKIVIKYGSEKSNSFILQIQNNNPPNNDKKRLTVLAIIGIFIGSLLGLLFLGWLLKKIVITPFILEPMRKKKSEAFQRQTEKDIAQMKADEAEEETKRKGEK